MKWISAEVGTILTHVDAKTAQVRDEALERTGYPPEKVPALITALGATGERDFNRRLWWVRWP